MKKLLILLLLISSKLFATDYYVSPSGSDSNPGTFAEPFLTITHAVSLCTDGIGGFTIYCRAGTYNERVRIWQKDGTEGSPNILQPYNDEDVVIDGTGIEIPAGSGLIYCDSEYWEFYDLEVRDVALEGTSAGGTGIWIDATGNLVSGCNVHDCWAGGIRSTGNYSIIENNYVKDVGLHNADWTEQEGESCSQGINTRDNTYNTIRGNKLRNIAGEGLSATRAENIIIEDNIIHNAYSTHFYIMNSQDVLVQRNLIYNDTLAGDNIVSTGIGYWNEGTTGGLNERVTIINNIVSGCGRNLYSACILYETLIANNIFINNRNPAAQTACVQLSSYAIDVGPAEFRNNIIIQEDSKNCIYPYISTGDTDNWTYSNNLYNKTYNSKAVGDNDIISTIHIKAEGEADEYSYYELLSTSPAIDAGYAIEEVDVDYLDVERDENIDIGPLEYVSPDTPILPVVVLTSSFQVYDLYALVSGNVIDDGGGTVSVRGVCWLRGTDGVPTIDSDTTINGSGTGSYTATLRILAVNTMYHARAYAINEQGAAYGEMVEFTTKQATDNKYVFYQDKMVFRDGLPLMSSGSSPPPPIEVDTLVTSINVAGAGGATTIVADNGTLQIYADVEPDNATDTAVVWSRVNRTGEGYINSEGLLTAQSDGIVTVRATAHDGSGIYDTLQITMSNQDPPPPPGDQIIIDHTSVALYDDIPIEYINAVKSMRFAIPGLSHASGYLKGLTLLEDLDGMYQVSCQYSDVAPYGSTTAYLRAGKNVWDALIPGWTIGYSVEEWAFSEGAVTNTKAGIAYTLSHGYDLDVMGFGWCTDGEYQAAEMSDYCDDTQEYIDYCTAQSYDTKVIFTTGPVDGYTGLSAYNNYTRYEVIRDFVDDDENKILFDYADILCWNDEGEPATEYYNATLIPVMHPDNMGGTYYAHIGTVGCLRLGKAIWVLMARIAGWDGE